MNIHLLTAEHFEVPGLITKAFTTAQDAETEAASITALMLKDARMDPLPDPEQWRDGIERLQEAHGAAHCYVEINEIAVQGSDVDNAEAMNRWHNRAQALHQHMEKAVTEWPGLDSDDEVSGADLVEWFAEWRATAKELVEWSK